MVQSTLPGLSSLVVWERDQGFRTLFSAGLRTNRYGDPQEQWRMSKPIWGPAVKDSVRHDEGFIDPLLRKGDLRRLTLMQRCRASRNPSKTKRDFPDRKIPSSLEFLLLEHECKWPCSDGLPAYYVLDRNRNYTNEEILVTLFLTRLVFDLWLI